LPLLRQNGLDSFEQLMLCDQGTIRRNFPGRRTSRLELAAPGAASQTVYLKRYFPDYLSPRRRLLRWMRWPGSGDEAVQEWDAIRQLRSLGLATVEPVALGQDAARPGAVSQSFLITAEVSGSDEGHRFLARLAPGERRKLLLQVAAITRVLHGAGWVHKDLYLGHFLVRPGKREPEAVLIDLQRATKPCWFRQRWTAKDLAALTYSCLKAGATRSDIAAGFKVYRGNRPFLRCDRRLARAVLRRIKWLKTRTPKHDTDFEQLS
jgi:hypothetical protein